MAVRRLSTPIPCLCRLTICDPKGGCVFFTLLQLVGLALFVTGCVLAAGVAGAFVGVGIATTYVGLAGES